MSGRTGTRRLRVALFLAVGLAATGIGLVAYGTNVFETIDLRSVDKRFSIRAWTNETEAPSDIVVVKVDDKTFDDLQRRFDEASRYADLDQLGIAPQCGFASTEEGNALTVEQQRRKLELVVRTAEAIWGGLDA